MCRKPFSSWTLIVIVLALSSLFFISPRSKTKAQNTSACCSQAVGPREIIFPYYSLAGGFNSTLLLVSDSPAPLNFILAIHSLSGQTELSDLMTIQPGAKLPIDLRALLANLGADVTGTFAQGSVSVYFEGTIMPLVGQMTIENPARHWVQQAEMVENDPGRTDIPAILSGQWWGLAGGRDATIMVTNASGNAVTADVFLAFGGQEHKVEPLAFYPNETKLLSVADMLAALNVDVAQAPEGRITIIQRGLNPSLVAQGRVTDPVTGFSTTLEFPDPARQHASALHATGIPIGTPTPESPFAGDGTFTPHVIASNLLDKPQTMTVTVEYPRSANWNSVNWPGGPDMPSVAKTAAFRISDQKTSTSPPSTPPNPDPSTLTGQFTLAPLTVGPNSTTDFSLDAVMGQLPLPVAFCSIRIQYSGAPGSMIAQVSSVDARQDLVVDARTMNEGDGWAGSGANPWHLDANTQSILFLTDEGDKAARIGFSVTAGGVHYYLTSLELAPHETRAIDLRKLRDDQVADQKKDLIPAAATDGGVTWIRLDNVPVMGRVMVISKQTGMASSYDCCICQCPATFDWTTFQIDPASLALQVGYAQQCQAYAYYYDCNGNKMWTQLWLGGVSWWSDNTSVAAIDGSVAGQVDGVGAGSTEVYGSTTDCWYYQVDYNTGQCACTDNETGTGSSSVDVGYGCNDDRDYIIQEYHDYPTSDISPFYPVCTNFTNNASTTNFSFAELNVNQTYGWAILIQVFLNGLQGTRNTYGASMTVNSGYREPDYNAEKGGARASQHVFGDAADIASDETTWFTLAHDANQEGACVEPYNYTGKNDYAHVHMDWRGTCPNGWTGF